jgi:NhaA family Na+:H+ antiporter
MVPHFAFAFGGVSFEGGIVGDSLSSSITLGIALGLLVGKPVGILLFCWCAVRMGMARLPGGASWPHLIGVGMLAGIGFTVALFINDLAFDTSEFTDEGKIGIFAGSIGSALLGLATMLFVTRGASRDPAPVDQP